jgi:hypothetical protein
MKCGTEVKRALGVLISAQELLRELLTLVPLQVDPVRHERQEVLKILRELRAGHYGS